MAADDDVTIGELKRLFGTLREDFAKMHESFVTQRVWEVEKRSFEERHRTMGREIGELRTTIEKMEAEKRAEHKAFDLELDAIRADGVARTEEARKARARNWFAISLAGLSAILAFGGGLLSNALSGGA